MEPFHTETFDGFTVHVYARPEDTDPSDLFDDCCADTVEAIRDGRCEWFTAMVTAECEGVELACTYLGGCAYFNLRDFIDPESYFGDMRAEVVADARANLARINAYIDSTSAL